MDNHTGELLFTSKMIPDFLKRARDEKRFNYDPNKNLTFTDLIEEWKAIRSAAERNLYSIPEEDEEFSGSLS